jgi:hypothetical protein
VSTSSIWLGDWGSQSARSRPALLSTVSASATTAYLASSHGAAAPAAHDYTTVFGSSAAAFPAGAILALLLFRGGKLAAEPSAESRVPRYAARRSSS